MINTPSWGAIFRRTLWNWVDDNSGWLFAIGIYVVAASIIGIFTYLLKHWPDLVMVGCLFFIAGFFLVKSIGVSKRIYGWGLNRWIAAKTELIRERTHELEGR